MSKLSDCSHVLTRTLFVTLISTLLLLGILAFFSKPNHWPPVENSPHQGEAVDATAFKNGQVIFSQEALSRFIREPQNTWSNFAFILGGAYLFSIGTTRTVRFLGIPLITVGIGSFLYHASISPTLRHFDAGSFTWLLLATSLFSIATFFPRLQEKMRLNLPLFGILTFLLAVGSTVARKMIIFGIAPLSLDAVLGVSAAILLGSLIFLAAIHRDRETAIKTMIILILFATSVVCEVGDHPGNWLFNPGNMVQAHALWHIFAATAFVLTVRTLDTASKHC